MHVVADSTVPPANLGMAATRTALVGMQSCTCSTADFQGSASLVVALSLLLALA